MEGFLLSPGVKFDVQPEELTGEWTFPCASTLTLSADGSGVRVYCGPTNVPEKPEPFRWSVSGAQLKSQKGDEEETAEIIWMSDEEFRVRNPKSSNKETEEGFYRRRPEEVQRQPKSENGQ